MGNGNGGYDPESQFFWWRWEDFVTVVRDWFSEPTPVTLGQLRGVVAGLGRRPRGRRPGELTLGEVEGLLEEHDLAHLSLAGVIALLDAVEERELDVRGAEEAFEGIELSRLAPVLGHKPGGLRPSDAASLAVFAARRKYKGDVLAGVTVAEVRDAVGSPALAGVTVRDMRALLEAVAAKR